MPILYAKYGGPPDNWADLIVKKNGREIIGVMEVDVLGCWAMITDHPGQTPYKIYGSFEIEARPPGHLPGIPSSIDAVKVPTLPQPPRDSSVPGKGNPAPGVTWAQPDDGRAPDGHIYGAPFWSTPQNDPGDSDPDDHIVYYNGAPFLLKIYEGEDDDAET